MLALILRAVLAAAICGAGTLASGLLPLVALRARRDRPWTERARWVYPARKIGLSNWFVLPGVSILALGFEPGFRLGGPAIAVVVGGWAGILLAGWPLRREAEGRAVPLGEHVSATTTFLALFWPNVLVVIVVVCLAPGPAVALASAALILVFLNHGGVLPFLALLGRLRPAPAGLSRAIARATAEVGIHPRRVDVLAWPVANALAFPVSGRLLFSDRLIEILDEDELASIAAHELAHLGEPRREKALRWIAGILPLALLVPFVFPETHGVFPVFGGLLLWVLGARWLQVRFRFLEQVADGVVARSEDLRLAYSRALARIYEANLVPLVLPEGEGTHPSLHERMAGAGALPEGIRPAAPPRFIVAVGMLLGALVAWGGWRLVQIWLGRIPPP